jgi:Resolvase, N terminal domain
MLIGYARVSKKQQDTQSQLDALTKAGCDEIHEEKKSGGILYPPSHSGKNPLQHQTGRHDHCLSDLRVKPRPLGWGCKRGRRSRPCL